MSFHPLWLDPIALHPSLKKKSHFTVCTESTSCDWYCYTSKHFPPALQPRVMYWQQMIQVVIMVNHWCVRCRRAEVYRYWSCPRHPVEQARIRSKGKLANEKPFFFLATFSVISCEWCKECSLSKNILCCSELARRQVSQVDNVHEEIPTDKIGKNCEGISSQVCFLVVTPCVQFYPDRPESWQQSGWIAWNLVVLWGRGQTGSWGCRQSDHRCSTPRTKSSENTRPADEVSKKIKTMKRGECKCPSSLRPKIYNTGETITPNWF